jgi:5-methylcytosine-specific restriction endonuclease McrA
MLLTRSTTLPTLKVPKFFDDARREKRGIVLLDNFYKLLRSHQQENLKLEVNSRWRLWETAISLNINPRLMEVNSDPSTNVLFIVNDKLRRVDVTSSREALNGYQKGKCFYCPQDIMIEPGHPTSCDVDHFFPDLLKGFGFSNLDQVWNLVLSCKDCNRGEQGKFERIPDLSFLNRLHKRNNFYVESHHPLKETIINQTGETEANRRAFLQSFFDHAVATIPSKWKPREQGEAF